MQFIPARAILLCKRAMNFQVVVRGTSWPCTSVPDVSLNLAISNCLIISRKSDENYRKYHCSTICMHLDDGGYWSGFLGDSRRFSQGSSRIFASIFIGILEGLCVNLHRDPRGSYRQFSPGSSVILSWIFWKPVTKDPYFKSCQL